MKSEKIPTTMLIQKDVKRIWDYNPENGIIKWRVRGGRSIVKGSIAGSKRKDGYVIINYKYALHRAHRVAWLYYYGELPKGEIDHINGKKHDNRINNLRVVSRADNCKNRRMRKDNKYGYTGLYYSQITKKWRAEIRVNGKGIHLGVFYQKEEAIKARKNAENEYGFHKNHGK